MNLKCGALMMSLFEQYLLRFFLDIFLSEYHCPEIIMGDDNRQIRIHFDTASANEVVAVSFCRHGRLLLMMVRNVNNLSRQGFNQLIGTMRDFFLTGVIHRGEVIA